jgi:LysR family transcriptional regulator, transcriptional activator of nhaA
MPLSLRRLDLTQLDYLRHVVRAGGVIAAATALRVAPQTVSGQINVLEDRLGHKLLERAGRNVRLTEMGRMVLEYGADMLARGEDLLTALDSGNRSAPGRFTLGVGALVPKLVVRRLAQPVLDLKPMPVLVFKEDTERGLVEDLIARRVDALLVNSVPSVDLGLDATMLAKSNVGVYGVPHLARKYRKNFPKSLTDAPMLLPTAGTEARRLVDSWFIDRKVAPTVIAEFDDAALREAFGATGTGLFLAPALIASDLKALYGVERLGILNELVARYFLVTPVRKRLTAAEIALRRQA